VVAVLFAAAGCSSPHGALTTPPATGSPSGAASRSPTLASTASSAPRLPGSPSPPCTDLAALVAGWSTARKAAELVAIPSLDFDVEELRAPLAAGAGGVLFLGSAPAPADLAARIRTAGALAAGVSAAGPPAAPLAAPLVMADEEGGGVQRLAALTGSLPWPRQMAASETPAQVRTQVELVAQRMRAAGVAMDLAPVLDADGGAGPNATDPDGQRSFSAEPAVVTAYGGAFAAGLEAGGVVPVAKHFPGLGGASGNTDNGAAQTLPLASLQAGAMAPFAAAIAAGIPAVMVANATVPGLTSGPASLSPAAIGGLLRTTLHFSGLVLTDSLSAGAIAAAGYTLPEAAAAAVEAGADLVLFGSTLTAADTALLTPANVAASFRSIVAALEAAAAAGQLPAARLDQAVRDVLALKARMAGAPAC
jgi:beta-N-acetylhexosaminidase